MTYRLAAAKVDLGSRQGDLGSRQGDLGSSTHFAHHCNHRRKRLLTRMKDVQARTKMAGGKSAGFTHHRGHSFSRSAPNQLNTFFISAPNQLNTFFISAQSVFHISSVCFSYQLSSNWKSTPNQLHYFNIKIYLHKALSAPSVTTP